MRRRFWLASYPKSGNTWFRLMLANLQRSEAVRINQLPPEPWLASAREAFDRVTLIASGLLTHEECDAFRPAVYRAMAQFEDPDLDDGGEGIGDALFAKVHDAWTLNGVSQAVLGGAAAAAGAILIVRDPRDIVASFAHHYGLTLDAAIAFMADPAASVAGHRDRQSAQLRQRTLDWSGFQASWLDQREVLVHVIRYEELHDDPARTLLRALDFAGVRATTGQVRRAADFAGFEGLKAQEAADGFGEAPRPLSGTRFFRKGVAGAWRDELSPVQVARIEERHGAMMERMGYELTERQRICA